MDVTTLVRHHREVVGGTIYWNPSKPGWRHSSDGAGEFRRGAPPERGQCGPAMDRDTTSGEIVVSRVGSTRALCEALAQVRQPPRVLVCASAIGIYGDRGEEVLTEASAPGTGFLAETCVAWEKAADKARAAGIRVVHARFGVVLSREGRRAEEDAARRFAWAWAASWAPDSSG